MKQYPSSLKYRKNHRSSKSILYLKETKNFYPNRGFISLKATKNCKLTYNQIEACRKSIRRSLRKQGYIFLRVFTNISVTKKSLASRMGSGKGSHSHWISNIKKGQIICELISEEYNKAYNALKKASNKLPIKGYITFNTY